MKRALFICTNNSARSQMAEALVNHDLAGRFSSAGVQLAVCRSVRDQIREKVVRRLAGREREEECGWKKEHCI